MSVRNTSSASVTGRQKLKYIINNRTYNNMIQLYTEGSDNLYKIAKNTRTMWAL